MGAIQGDRIVMEKRAPVLSRDDLELLCRQVVSETLDHLGIDNETFIGRERMRANLAFLQLLRDQHEDRGREFRRGFFQNTGNLLAFTVVSSLLLAGGYLIGHGFVLK